MAANGFRGVQRGPDRWCLAIAYFQGVNDRAYPQPRNASVQASEVHMAAYVLFTYWDVLTEWYVLFSRAFYWSNVFVTFHFNSLQHLNDC